MQQRHSVRLLALMMILATGGCAAGNTYDYRNALAGIPLTGTTAINVEVIDQRPYILDGEKEPTFVGLQRGGYGNPFNVNTTSGEPLAVDMESALESILQTRGFQIVQADDEAKQRTLRIVLTEWKSDVMLRMRVIYNVIARVLDASGELLAEHSIQGEEVMGGGMQSANSANAARTFEAKMSELLRHEAIAKAINNP